MANIEIAPAQINDVLFRFLQSVYLFEKREQSLFDVSWDEVYLLQLLVRQHPMTVSELAEKLKVKTFTASRMITRLSSQNLVIREPAADDRRRVKVSITPYGLEKIRQIEAFNYHTILSNIHTLGDMEIRTLMKSIEKLEDLLGLHPWKGEETNELGE